jgi:hypothetical protein
MADVYAKIGNGAVVNVQVAEFTDYFDPAFTWVDLTATSAYCSDGTAIVIGTLYDGSNFTQPTG